MDKSRFILVNNRLACGLALSKRCICLGRFLDKKTLPKKFFVYAHIVPVDIHTVIHSLQPLFYPAFERVARLATNNVALAGHWW